MLRVPVSTDLTGDEPAADKAPKSLYGQLLERWRSDSSRYSRIPSSPEEHISYASMVAPFGRLFQISDACGMLVSPGLAGWLESLRTETMHCTASCVLGYLPLSPYSCGRTSSLRPPAKQVSVTLPCR